MVAEFILVYAAHFYYQKFAYIGDFYTKESCEKAKVLVMEKFSPKADKEGYLICVKK